MITGLMLTRLMPTRLMLTRLMPTRLMLIGLIALALAALASGGAAAQDLQQDDTGVEIPATPSAPPRGDTTSTIRLHFQAGAHLRLNKAKYDPWDDDAGAMLTWSLVAMKWDRRSPTWGLGLRAAIDDIGERIGPMAFRRWAVGDRPGGYLQLSGGVYTKGSEYDFGSGFPGWFVEAEAAPNNLIAVSLGFERVSVAYWDYSNFEGSRVLTATDTGWYAGAKLGQGLGLLGTAALFGIAAASFSSSGWY
jgi:hypothetical protein